MIKHPDDYRTYSLGSSLMDNLMEIRKIGDSKKVVFFADYYLINLLFIK